MNDAQVVMVFGPTGTAGAGAVQAAIDHAAVREVRAITRRPLDISHAKLREVKCSDFSDLSPIAGEFEGVGCCLFCLGTSSRNVDGEEQYREIHVGYPLAAAEVLVAASPDASFVYISGASTRRDSRMMWSRVKAEAEDRLGESGVARVANVRPAAILPLEPTGPSRWLLAPFLKLVPAMGIGALQLGQAMLRLGLDHDWRGSRTLENAELRALAAEAR